MDPIDKLIYDPSDAVTATTKYLEDSRQAIASGLGLHFPIPDIAEEYPIPPLLPGNIFMILAVTSNGKSTFKEFWMSDAAARITESKSSNHVLISISAEDLVEEQMADTMRREAAKLGKVESLKTEDGLLTMAAHIGSTPVYYIGASIARAGTDVPDPNMTNITKCIWRIINRRKDKNQDTVVMGTFLDYIQALPLDPDLMRVVADKRRRLQVREDFYAYRKLSRSIPTPAVALVQAKIDVPGAPGKNMLTPGLTDTQEASAIAQHTDRGVSMWMPKTTHTHGREYEHGEMRYKVIPNLTMLKCVKQRGRDPVTLKRLPAGRTWALYLDFDTGDYYKYDDPADTIQDGVPSRPERRAAEGKNPIADW